MADMSVEEIRQAFDALDTDHSGSLSRSELAAVFRAVKVEPTKVEMDYIFKEIDKDHSGKISKEEFVKYMSQPPKHRATIEDLTADFQLFDTDGDGAITLDELEKLLTKTTNFSNSREVREMFELTDRNGDGRITFKEFVDLMKE